MVFKTTRIRTQEKDQERERESEFFKTQNNKDELLTVIRSETSNSQSGVNRQLECTVKG